jgi:hypothetical protein
VLFFSEINVHAAIREQNVCESHPHPIFLSKPHAGHRPVGHPNILSDTWSACTWTARWRDSFRQGFDIDFVVVTGQDISGELFAALQAMRDRISAMDSPGRSSWKAPTISRQAIRRYDPEHAFPNLEQA